VLMDELPPEVLYHIPLRLSVPDIFTLSQVCRSLFIASMEICLWEKKYRELQQLSEYSLPGTTEIKRACRRLVDQGDQNLDSIIKLLNLRPRMYLTTTLLQLQLSKVVIEFQEDIALQVFKRLSMHIWQHAIRYQINRARKDLIVTSDPSSLFSHVKNQHLKLSTSTQTYGIALLQGIDSLMTRCRHGCIKIKCYDSLQRDCVYSKNEIPQVKPGSLVLVDKEQVKLLHVYKPEEEELLIEIGEIAKDFIPNRNYRWPSNTFVY